MPEPAGLVVKNGTNRLAGLAIPGPSSCTYKYSELPFLDQPIRTLPPVSSVASTALRMRLISNCCTWSGSTSMVSSGPGVKSTAILVSKITALRTRVPTETGRSWGLGRRAMRP